jgi:hypothetical protein
LYPRSDKAMTGSAPGVPVPPSMMASGLAASAGNTWAVKEESDPAYRSLVITLMSAAFALCESASCMRSPNASENPMNATVFNPRAFM